MKKIFANQQWIKILTRDMAFVRLAIIYESYCERAKKDIGINYPMGFAILQNGVFNIHRSEKALKSFANSFLKIKDKEAFFERIVKKTQAATKRSEKVIKFCENKIRLNGDLSEKEWLDLFKRLYEAFRGFWVLQYFPMNFEFALSHIKRNDVILKYKKYLVGMRKETQYVTVKLEDLIDVALKKVGRGLEKDLILYATPSEIVGNKIKQPELIRRKKISVLGFNNNKRFIFTGNQAKEIAKLVVSSEKLSKSGEIKGSSVYYGKVQGVIRVILFRKDLENLKKGEILVTPMTEAFYTPYLKKAKAIVTDEGGITCHAAIISREMKIPCVIGARIATKILKDGDIVEVDANKGIVKILNK